MTLEEWADRVDELIAAEGAELPAHRSAGETAAQLHARGVPGFTAQDPTWEHDRRIVVLRVAEDDSSLRAVFVPRDEADEAYPSAELSRTRTYLRGDTSAHDAARDVISFLTLAG